MFVVAAILTFLLYRPPVRELQTSLTTKEKFFQVRSSSHRDLAPANAGREVGLGRLWVDRLSGCPVCGWIIMGRKPL